MTDETENLILKILREIQQGQSEMKDQIATLERKVDLHATRDEMDHRLDRFSDEVNLRFDQVADLMTVAVSAQADTIRRVEDLETSDA